MACQLENIIAAIAGIGVTTDSITPTVYYGATLKQGGDNAPMRVILPSDVDSAQRGVRFATVGSGGVMSVSWSISDLFLMQNTKTGSGLNQVATTLVRYAAAYVDALKNKQSLITGNNAITIEAVTFNIGGFQYPAGIEAWYWGVEVRYQVKEIVS